MLENEWRLVYPGEDFTFGTGASDVFNVTAPDLGDIPLRVDDAEVPRGDGGLFGVDFHGQRTITFDLGITGDTPTDIRASVAALTLAWRADSVRTVPGAVAELRARYRGEERLVYGRPRRFAPNLREVSTGLFASATADFLCSDDRFYSVDEHVAIVSLVPPLGGGLLAPLGSPLATSESSDRSIVLDVEGELPAWPLIEIDGPITNPVIEVVGLWKLAFNLTLAYDQTLVIDTAPWARTILRNGASVAGSIARTSTRLSKAALPPGSWELALRGTSSTGTPVARIRWHDSYSTL